MYVALCVKDLDIRNKIWFVYFVLHLCSLLILKKNSFKLSSLVKC